MDQVVLSIPFMIINLLVKLIMRIFIPTSKAVGYQITFFVKRIAALYFYIIKPYSELRTFIAFNF